MTHTGPDSLPQAFFLPANPGRRFCLFHTSQSTAIRGRVLHLHAFAEEMHAARRVVAQQCRSLAASGYAVLQIDLLGCGDSTGDFGDATWSAWLQDALLALRWLEKRTPTCPTWLWGLRAGALLACATATERLSKQPDEQLHLLLWQPVASGQQQLQQFMRLHTAAQWLGRAAMGEPPAQLLSKGQLAQVAGYSLSPTLAAELGQAQLDLPNGTGRVALLELSATPPANTSPWIARQQSHWQAAGRLVHAEAVVTPPFWQNVVASSLSAALNHATLQAMA